MGHINITTFDNLLFTLGCKVLIFKGFVGDSNKRLIEIESYRNLTVVVVS
jgi:hypothetical protein